LNRNVHGAVAILPPRFFISIAAKNGNIPQIEASFVCFGRFISKLQCRRRDNSRNTGRSLSMTTQEFTTYQEQTFDSYAKRLIHNEGADAKKELARRAKREAQLSALSVGELSALAGEDGYCLEKVTVFARGKEVNVFDAVLGQALSVLPPKWRDVLVLYYFLDESDTQIAGRLNMTTSGISHRRKVALARLKGVLEALGYEK